VYIARAPGGCRPAGRVADGAIMQGCVAEPLLAFFKDTVAGAREVGDRPRSTRGAINVCVDDDRQAARTSDPDHRAACPPSARLLHVRHGG
jgi:hypothetical protein